MKRFLSLILVLAITLATIIFVAPPIEASAATNLSENEFASKISELKERYPHGQYWNITH